MQHKLMKENLIKELRNLAMEDGIETFEESDIISNVIYNFDKFNEVLELARQDNKITYKEKTDLLQIICKIDYEAQNIAEKDGVITEDEMRLMYHLCYQTGVLEDYIKQLKEN
ncbi:MAG: hypothetical protein GPJ54_11725 [Candidatus Heimdallarchaeota archaeon]|nr:hypothetical protein [Candidatus Heimdallarchaeota archaeon]